MAVPVVMAVVRIMFAVGHSPLVSLCPHLPSDPEAKDAQKVHRSPVEAAQNPLSRYAMMMQPCLI
jgi:hypothetical protein